MTVADRTKRPTIYLANPLGFSEAGRKFIDDTIVPALSKHGKVIDPFKLIGPARFRKIEAMHAGPNRVKAWQAMNAEIGQINQDHIDASGIVFAVLDGVDVDSGTASEIGYAYARGKLIIGYRGDFRLSADNEGGVVNLQVEHFIRASGGTVIRALSELKKAFRTARPRKQ